MSLSMLFNAPLVEWVKFISFIEQCVLYLTSFKKVTFVFILYDCIFVH